MKFSISFTSFNGQTRLTVNFDGSSGVFDFGQSFPVDNPISQLFAPASNGCENLAEFFENCAQITREALIDDSSPSVGARLVVHDMGSTTPPPSGPNDEAFVLAEQWAIADMAESLALKPLQSQSRMPDPPPRGLNYMGVDGDGRDAGDG